MSRACTYLHAQLLVAPKESYTHKWSLLEHLQTQKEMEALGDSFREASKATKTEESRTTDKKGGKFKHEMDG